MGFEMHRLVPKYAKMWGQVDSKYGDVKKSVQNTLRICA